MQWPRSLLSVITFVSLLARSACPLIHRHVAVIASASYLYAGRLGCLSPICIMQQQRVYLLHVLYWPAGLPPHPPPQSCLSTSPHIRRHSGFLLSDGVCSHCSKTIHTMLLSVVPHCGPSAFNTSYFVVLIHASTFQLLHSYGQHTLCFVVATAANCGPTF